ncbi:MAG: secondary thiamine-phosphate synthase enzyme YjbQ [Pseudomonadota bacterium]
MPTRGQRCYDITAPVAEWVRREELSDGLLCAFVTHTTASLTIQENADARVQDDLVSALDRLAPPDAPYTHNDEGPDDMPGHIKAMMCGANVALPCAAGRLALGVWQALYLLEHRNRARTRTVHLTFVGR